MAVMSESALSAASLLDDGAASDEVGPWVAVLGPDADRAAHHLRPGDDGRLVLRAVGPGRAPSVGRSGDRQVIFDGQLHNAHDLARALAAPAGTPAADLVARAHERWGDASLQRLKGTFACAIWMAATGTLKLVRDPVGTYPFFFSESGGRIAFGVDAEPLLSLPWVSRALNRAAIADHLSHRWLSWHETHYQDLSRVPAGFVVTWQGGTRRFERYWHPVDPSGNVEWVREDALDQFQEVFEQAIERCLGQGPAAIFLSGGFDSVSIGVTAAELSRRRGEAPPIAASLFFPDPTCDEEPIQRAVAQQLGLPHVGVRLDEALASVGLIQAGVEINRTASMPMMNAWRPAYRALGDRARAAGARVTMTGEGGDEWLTVGPEYMVDLLRRFDLAGLNRMLGTILRSYRHQPDLASVQYALAFRRAAAAGLVGAGPAATRGAEASVRAQALSTRSSQSGMGVARARTAT